MVRRLPPRDERGVVFPSPMVILSVVAVAMAGIAFVATRDGAPEEKQISTISQPETTPSTTEPTTTQPETTPSTTEPATQPATTSSP